MKCSTETPIKVHDSGAVVESRKLSASRANHDVDCHFVSQASCGGLFINGHDCAEEVGSHQGEPRELALIDGFATEMSPIPTPLRMTPSLRPTPLEKVHQTLRSTGLYWLHVGVL